MNISSFSCLIFEYAHRFCLWLCLYFLFRILFLWRKEVIVANSILLNRNWVISCPSINFFGKSDISFVEGISSVEFCLLLNGCFVVFVLIQMIKHVFFLLGDKKAIVLILCSHNSTSCFFALCLGFRLWFLLTFLCKIIEALDKLFGKESFILLKPVLLASEGSCFNILYFEFDGSRRDRWDVYVEIIPHKIIITTIRNQFCCFYSYFIENHISWTDSSSL